jgi:hypothetical protein
LAKRPRRRRAERAAEGDRSGREVHAVDLALEVRLFGRVRLLTIDAVVEVAGPTAGRRVLPSTAVAPSTGVRREERPVLRRRVDAEALLDDAARVLVAGGNGSARG